MALLLAQLVRFEIVSGRDESAAHWITSSFLPWLPVFVGLKLLIFGKMKLFRSGWRYASIRDITNILLASWLFVLIMFLAVYLFRYLPQWIESEGRAHLHSRRQ